MAKEGQGPVRFRRIRGRIIPIREKKAARGIAKAIDARSAIVIGGSVVAGLAGLFGAGRLARLAGKLEKAGKIKKAFAVEKTAKVGKFISKFGTATVVGTEIVRIDRKTTADEQSRFLDLGNKSGAVNVALAGATAFAFTRIGKRFEKFGLRGGKFPFRLKDI